MYPEEQEPHKLFPLLLHVEHPVTEAEQLLQVLLVEFKIKLTLH